MILLCSIDGAGGSDDMADVIFLNGFYDWVFCMIPGYRSNHHHRQLFYKWAKGFHTSRSGSRGQEGKKGGERERRGRGRGGGVDFYPSSRPLDAEASRRTE